MTAMRIRQPRPLHTRPTVSVVVPCYNYGRYLPQAVGSALDQSGVDVEVLIVDDASTDDSVTVARALAAADPRVDVLPHEINRGHIATYNDGLSKARGDYIGLLSADDVMAPDALTRSVALMEHHPDVGMVYGAIETFSDEPPQLPRHRPSRWAVWEGQDWAERVFASGTNVAYSPEVLLRSSVQHEIGGYDPEHPHAGDFLMWLRAGAVANVGVLGDSVQALYRQHQTNMHSSVFGVESGRGLINDLEARSRVFDDAAGDYPAGDSLLLSGRRALAVEAVGLAARAYVWGLTNDWPVAELVEFARGLDDDIETTREWRMLARRRRLGARLSRKNPAFVPRELRLTRQGEIHARRRREGWTP